MFFFFNKCYNLNEIKMVTLWNTTSFALMKYDLVCVSDGKYMFALIDDTLIFNFTCIFFFHQEIYYYIYSLFFSAFVSSILP